MEISTIQDFRTALATGGDHYFVNSIDMNDDLDFVWTPVTALAQMMVVIDFGNFELMNLRTSSALISYSSYQNLQLKNPKFVNLTCNDLNDALFKLNSEGTGINVPSMFKVLTDPDKKSYFGVIFQGGDPSFLLQGGSPYSVTSLDGTYLEFEFNNKTTPLDNHTFSTLSLDIIDTTIWIKNQNVPISTTSIFRGDLSVNFNNVAIYGDTPGFVVSCSPSASLSLQNTHLSTVGLQPRISLEGGTSNVTIVDSYEVDDGSTALSSQVPGLQVVPAVKARFIDDSTADAATLEHLQDVVGFNVVEG